MTDAGLSEFSKWLAATPLSHTIQTTGWIIPAVQTIHILSVAVLFSSAIIVDLRIWQLLQRDVPLPEVARRFLPAIWPVLLILLILQRSISSSPNFWDRDRGRRIAGRLAATASILVWCGILFAGRWIAYTQAG
jgi:hypothetical protein